MADSRQDRERQEALDAEQAKLSEENIKSLRKLSDQFDVAAQQARESNKINLELAEIAKMEGDDIAARDLRASAIADAMKANTLVLQAGKEDAKAERLDKKRLNAAAKGDRLEKNKEEQARLKKLGATGRLKEKDKDIGGPIKTPSFLMKLAKLALGIVGVKVFSVMINNFDSIKKFVKEKILPATEGIFTFFKETVFPFISDNFKEIMNGFVLLAGVFLAGFVFIKIINAVKMVRRGIIAVKLGMLATGGGLMSIVKGPVALFKKALTLLRAGFVAVSAATMTVGNNLMSMVTGALKNLIKFVLPFLKTAYASVSAATMTVGTSLMTMVTGVLSKLGTAVKFLRAGFLAVTGLTMSTLVPALTGIVATMSVALAPFLPIIIGVGLAIAGIALLLNKVKNALGFDSIFDVMLLGVEHMKDGLAVVANFFIKIAQKLAGLGGGLLEKLGIKVPDFVKNLENAELMDTNGAEKFKASVYEKQEKAEKLKGSQLSTIPTKEMEKPGWFGRKLDALTTGRNDVENMSAMGGGNLAVQNISAPTTTNNSQSSAVYGDASPATDPLDRVAFC